MANHRTNSNNSLIWIIGVILILAIAVGVAYQISQRYNPKDVPDEQRISNPNNNTCIDFEKNVKELTANLDRIIEQSTVFKEVTKNSLIELTTVAKAQVDALKISDLDTKNLKIAANELSIKVVAIDSDVKSLIISDDKTKKSEAITKINEYLTNLNTITSNLESHCNQNSEQSLVKEQLTVLNDKYDSLLTKVLNLQADVEKLEKSITAIVLNIFAFILTWGVIFFVFRSIQSKVKYSLEDTKEILELNTKERAKLISRLTNLEDLVKTEQLNLSNKIDELSKKNIVVNPDYQQTVKSSFPEEPRQVITRAKKSPLISPSVYYTFAPDNSNNCFDENNFSGQITPDSLYEISFAINASTAEFEFINRQDIVKFAIRYPETSLFSACDNENPFNPDATGIKTIQKGIASKQGNKWNIDKKSIIRFEV